VTETPIANYLRFPIPESDEAGDTLERLNELAVRDGWRHAIEQVYRSEPSRIRYAVDPARYRFLDLLPLTRESTVLEIGSSLGQITVPLAERVGFLYALEVEPRQARFTAERCRQEGLSNVAVACGGDDCHLPYEDGAMEGVVLNLVLEWCGARDLSTPLMESQRRLLKECCRVLEPGGWLFLTTKNRFGLRYLLGKPDEHTFEWRFGQALPRWLLAILLRLYGKSRPNGLIHSFRATSRLLSEAGFSNLRPYWAIPEYRFPREFIPAEPASIAAARRRPEFVNPGDPKSTRLLARLVPTPLVKHVMLGLVFLVNKPKGSRARMSRSS
jgi:SAM-dependent methyltransferase